MRRKVTRIKGCDCEAYPFCEHKALATPRPKEWVDITAEQYKHTRYCAFVSGATWLRSVDFPDGFLVFAGYPHEIPEYFKTNPDKTVRLEFVPEGK